MVNENGLIFKQDYFLHAIVSFMLCNTNHKEITASLTGTVIKQHVWNTQDENKYLSRVLRYYIMRPEK